MHCSGASCVSRTFAGASRAGSLPTCRMLYRHPGGERTVRQSNDAGWRPLRIASQHDQISTCLWLIAHGAADWSDNWCTNAEKASVRSVGRYAGKNECVSLEIVSVDLPDGALGSGPSLPRSSPRGVNGEGPLPSTTTTRQRRVNSSQSGRKSVRARVVGAAREFLELHSVFVQGFVLGAGARNFSDGSSKGIYSGNANNHDIISRRVALRAEVSALSGPMHLVASFLFEYGWPLGPCLTRIRSLVRVVSAIDAQESTTSNMSESAAAATHAAMQRSNTATTESSDTLAMASDSGVGSSSPASNIAETHAASSPRAALEVAPGATATVSLHKTEEEEVTSSSSISLHSSQLEGGSAIATTKSRTGRSSGSTEPLRGDSSGSSRNWHTSDAVPAWLTGWNSTTTAVLATVAVAVSIAALLSADQQRKRQHF